ncbi:MAG: hypothetical protein JSS02_05525 [Planctomycetes bacterium]|nr:hypothetical protein [Planctomycetota bacterium]
MSVSTKTAIIVTSIIAVTIFTGSVANGELILFDVPNSTFTQITGVSGSTIVGNFGSSNSSPYRVEGFAYDGTSLVIIDAPGGTAGTVLSGIDGGTIVGAGIPQNGMSQPFVFKSGVFSPFNVPDAIHTDLTGISGNNLIGIYQDPINGLTGFVSDGTLYYTLIYPGALHTTPLGVSGQSIVGAFDSTPYGLLRLHGFIYDGNDFLQFADIPGAFETYLTGISGSNLVGAYDDGVSKSAGLFFDGVNLTTFSIPGATQTWPQEIYGGTIVGIYAGTDHIQHGFIVSSNDLSLYPAIPIGGAVAAVPEPPAVLVTAVLIGLNVLTWALMRSSGWMPLLPGRAPTLSPKRTAA